RAVLLGLEGETPEGVDIDQIPRWLERIAREQTIHLLKSNLIPFDPNKDLLFHRMENLPEHPNGMRFVARDASGTELTSRVFYSPGGGFVRGETDRDATATTEKTFPFSSAEELLQLTTGQKISISEFMLRYESRNRSEA